MKQNRSKGNRQLRQMITRESARLMYEEGVSQYFDAKRMAARRVLGHHGGRKILRFRPRDLPSNGEISDELARLARFHEGDNHQLRLFAMRVVALDIMNSLADFSPRLIGSVSTGRVRDGSDIDLHVFCDVESLQQHLHTLNWAYEMREITIRKNNRLCDYTHLYLHRHFPVELSVYPPADLRVRGRSSTDGKPIVRLKPQALLKLIMEEHANAWHQYLACGTIDGVQDP